MDIPNNWEWVRIKNLCLDVFHGRSPQYSKKATECKIIGQQANQNYGIDLSYVKYGTLDFLSQITEREYLQQYDVLLNTLGNGTVGRSGIYINSTPDKILTDGHIFIFRNLNPTISIYFYEYLQEKQESIEKSADGTTNQTFLNLSKTLEWLIPLPPLSEQKRIVSEIERIFEQIEVVKTNQEELSKLKDGLKNKILDLAIQGKLVEQDPNDEPASELLKKIKAEKAELVKQGKIKKDKQESRIFKGDDNRHYEQIGSETKDITEEIPFDIPNNWCWCRLKDICNIFGRIGFRGYTKNDIVSEGQGAITISPSNIKKGKTIFDNNTYISWEKYYESPEIMVYNNDIILVKTGSSYGKSAIVTNLEEKATLNPQLVVLKYILCCGQYLDYILQSPLATQQFENFVIGTAIPTFSQEKLSQLLLPLPSIKEQQRIVNKLERINKYTDNL